MEILLPEIQSYKLNKENPKYGWPDQYGSSYIAAEYMKIKHSNTLLKHHWLHGCNGPWENIHPLLYIREIPEEHYILVARKDQEIYLKSHGAKKVKAIGLPIAYISDTNSPKRQENSILLMPTHLRPAEKYATLEMIKEYILFAKEISADFGYKAICLHSHFFKFQEFLDEFTNAGIHIIEGASNDDKNALKRQKSMFEQFEVMCTNGWGSHVAYALAFGSKVSICGPKIEKSKEDFLQAPGWENRKDVIEKMFLPEVLLEKESFLKKFQVYPRDSFADKELGKFLIGDDCKISPEEMKAFFKKNISYKISSVLKLIMKKNIKDVEKN